MNEVTLFPLSRTGFVIVMSDITHIIVRKEVTPSCHNPFLGRILKRNVPLPVSYPAFTIVFCI